MEISVKLFFVNCDGVDKKKIFFNYISESVCLFFEKMYILYIKLID